MDDETLIARLAEGDDAALTPLMQRHNQYLQRFIAKKVGHHTAQDVMQETWMHVRIKAGQFRGGKARAWLSVIAIRKAFTMLKRPNMRMRLMEALSPAAPVKVVQPSTEADEAEIRNIVNKQISKLSEVNQHLVRSYFFDGMKYGEIAKDNDIPIGTVKSRMSSIREKLIKLLESANIASA